MFYRRVSLLQVALFLIAVVLVIATVERTFFRDRGSVRPSRETARGELGAERRQELEEGRAEFAADEQRNVIRLADETSASVQAALAQIDQWNAEIEPLRNNFEGQVIAGDEELAGQIHYLFVKERLRADKLKEMLSRVSTLAEQVRESHQWNRDERPEQHVMEEIEALHASVSEAQAAWTRAVEQASAIRREASRRNPVPSNELLQVYLERASDQEALADLNVDQQDDKEAERKRKEREAAKAAKDAEIQAKMEELIKEATAPEVLATLAPFVTPQFSQPTLEGMAVRKRTTTEKRPVSLSWLLEVGALDDSDEGRKVLARIGADRDLPEPRWSFPTEPGNWSETNIEFLNRAQQMLRDYGEILVDKGKLAP